MSTIQNRPTQPEGTPQPAIVGVPTRTRPKAAGHTGRSSGTRSLRHLSVVNQQPPPGAWLGRASKFDPAPVRAGTLERERLLRRVARADDALITLISASAGHGKSTLARQWCERSQRRVAWINLDSSDNDPVAFLTSIAHALDRLDPIAPELLAELTAPKTRILDFALPAITRELDRLSPLELVLDDAHELTEDGSLDVLDLLLDGVRPGTHVTLVTRTELHLPLARRRLTGNLVEIRAEDLAFDPGEISELAATRGMDLSETHSRSWEIERKDGRPGSLSRSRHSTSPPPPPTLRKRSPATSARSPTISSRSSSTRRRRRRVDSCSRPPCCPS